MKLTIGAWPLAAGILSNERKMLTSHPRMLIYVGILALAGSATCPAKDKAEEKGRSLIKAAAEKSLLHPDGRTAFNVRLNFIIRAPGSKVMGGTYSWMVSSNGDWRKEVSASDYSDIEVGRGSDVWIKRTLNFKPLQAFWADRVFDNFASLDAPDLTVEKYSTEHSTELPCMEVSRSKMRQNACFDAQGNLLRVEGTGEYYEYSEYRQVGEKSLPHRVVLKRKGNIILEGTIESLPVEDDSALAVLPAGALRRVGCLVPTPPRAIKQVGPNYPVNLRGVQEGTVVMYALIRADGKVENLVVIETAGKDMDDASVSAVRTWKFEPAKCAGVPVDYESMISTSFSLRR